MLSGAQTIRGIVVGENKPAKIKVMQEWSRQISGGNGSYGMVNWNQRINLSNPFSEHIPFSLIATPERWDDEAIRHILNLRVALIVIDVNDAIENKKNKIQFFKEKLAALDLKVVVIEIDEMRKGDDEPLTPAALAELKIPQENYLRLSTISNIFVPLHQHFSLVAQAYLSLPLARREAQSVATIMAAAQAATLHGEVAPTDPSYFVVMPKREHMTAWSRYETILASLRSKACQLQSAQASQEILDLLEAANLAIANASEEQILLAAQTLEAADEALTASQQVSADDPSTWDTFTKEMSKLHTVAKQTLGKPDRRTQLMGAALLAFGIAIVAAVVVGCVAAALVATPAILFLIDVVGMLPFLFIGMLPAAAGGALVYNYGRRGLSAASTLFAKQLETRTGVDIDLPAASMRRNFLTYLRS